MFRFTIRELVLLTLVVAVGVAWWVDRQAAWKTVAKKDEKLLIQIAELTERAENAEYWVRQWRPVMSGSSGGLGGGAEKPTERKSKETETPQAVVP